MSSMDDINKPLRDAVLARQAEASKKEQLTGTPGVCMHADTTKFEESLASAAAALRIPADVPAAFLKSVEGVELTPVQPVEVREPEPVMLGATMPGDQLAAAWAGIRDRATEARLKIYKPPAEEDAEVVWSADSTTCRVIGITGRIGAGKNTAASLVPGAVVIGFADPLYAMLSAMLGLPESWLRDRRNKDTVIPWLGVSPRHLLQTLGTEWGRGLVRSNVWIVLARRKMRQLVSDGARCIVFADVRFDNEGDSVREWGGETWMIDGNWVAGDDQHISESGISPELIDRTIDNRGTIDDLQRAVLAALSV